MVFTVVENVAFFEDLDQLAMELSTINKLVNEGINDVEDLRDFDEDSLKQMEKSPMSCGSYSRPDDWSSRMSGSGSNDSHPSIQDWREVILAVFGRY